ncbi:MAG: sensor histidine kinase [Spirochaetota bacterium]
MLKKIPVTVALLDEERQVVFGRERLLELAGRSEPGRTDYSGPGDLIGCVNSLASKGGCGTSEACTLCGAFCAISQSVARRTTVTRECRIRYEAGSVVNDIDLSVTAAPYEASGNHYTLLTVQDISGEKRRRALERVFFHDITNLAGGLAGLASVLQTVPTPEEQREMLSAMEQSTRSLLDEIDAQRQLADAERGELVVRPTDIRVRTLLTQVADSLRYHSAAQRRSIVVDETTADFEIEVDATLLRRVLINITKNALEASLPGQSVTLAARRGGDTVAFTVHNSGVIPAEARHQLFQRSFSTKGDGRGLGTYSVRLLTEQYLRGKVSFTSTEHDGTLFSVNLPITVG